MNRDEKEIQPLAEKVNPRKDFTPDLQRVLEQFPALKIGDAPKSGTDADKTLKVITNVSCKELPSYDDYNYHVFDADYDNVESSNYGKSYVIKCCHAELVSAGHIEFQAAITSHIHNSGVLRVPEIYRPASETSWSVRIDNCRAHIVGFVPDCKLYPEGVPKTAKFLEYLGIITPLAGVGFYICIVITQLRVNINIINTNIHGNFAKIVYLI